MSLSLVTAPTTEPLTLAEAKAHLRVLFPDDDDYITTLITAARSMAENVCSRSFITTAWRLTLDTFPCDDTIIVPQPPLQSVTSITYYDSENNSQTLAASAYNVDIYREPGRIVRSFGSYWPATYPRPNAVTVLFSAGYGAAASNVPTPIIQAIKIMVSQWYENREPVVTGTIATEIPMSADYLLAPYRALESP